MPGKLGLFTEPLGTSWRPLLSPCDGNVIEVTGDVNWEWRTNTAVRQVLAGIDHPLVTSPYRPDPQPFVDPAPVTRFAEGEQICEVRALTAGNIWIKCVR